MSLLLGMVRPPQKVTASPQPNKPVEADPRQQAKITYQQGKKLYQVGEFLAAATKFKQAYKLTPKPIFLFNIAQSYRLHGDCKTALFYYEQFSGENTDPKLATLTDDLVAELQATCRQSDMGKQQTPAVSKETPLPSQKAPKTTTVTSPPPSDNKLVKPTKPRKKVGLVIGLLAGPSWVGAGDANTSFVPLVLAEIGAQFTAKKVRLHGVLGASISPLRYEDTLGNGTIILTGVTLGLQAMHKVRGSNIQIGVEGIAGVTSIRGLDAGNPLVIDGGTSSTLWSPTFGGAVVIDIPLSDRIAIYAKPARITVTASKESLEPDITRIITLSSTLGIRFRGK